MSTKQPIWPSGRFGVPQITPFTYRDGHTHMELIEALRDHLVERLHPSLVATVNSLVEQMEAEYGKALDQYVNGVEEFQRIHDQFMSDVNASLMALNDTAVSDLVDDETSMLGGKLRELFPDIAEFQGLGNLVVTGELTVPRIEQAAAQALTENKTLVVSGELRTEDTLMIEGRSDLSNLTIRYSGDGVALQIGTPLTNTHRHTYLLPRMITHTRKTHGDGSGWGAVQGTVGVRVVNVQSSANITVPHVIGFDTGLLMEGTNNRGCVYNTVFIGQLDNNRRNLVISPTHGGWSGQHTFVGGRLSHVLSEGTLVPGVEQVLLENPPGSHMPDNNLFLNTSVEGSIAQYILSIAGQANLFVNARFEPSDTSQPLTVRWQRNAQRNHIMYGRNAYLLKEHYDDGAQLSNNILAERQRLNMSGREPVLQVSNSSGTRPAIGVYSPRVRRDGADPEHAWGVLMSHYMTELKTTDDEHARIKFWHEQRRITFGDGTESQDAISGLPGIGNSYGGMAVFGGSLLVADGDIGQESLGVSPHNVYARNGVDAGSFVRTGRHPASNLPSASDYRQGAMIYNYTTRMPLWSDGTDWRNAMGETI